MTPAVAKNFHEISLENGNEESEIAKILANAQVNPTERQIKHLYSKWRRANFGGREAFDMLAVLKKKRECYEEKNIKVIIQENPLIVVVLTPIMMRAHSQEFAHEMVFVDSSGSCDQTSTCVTFLFCATKIGAIPLACILHTEQTEKNYTEAFKLLRDSLKTDGFGGYGFPQILMSDDSAAERNALESVFPESRKLLCIFHLLQAFWRWLWNSKNDIGKQDRKHIMAHFRRVLYATTNDELSENFSKFMNDEVIKKYGNLKFYILDYWARKEEWSLACRSNLLTRGNNTNNYVEASIRIFKDIVLERCKAFNSCALIDFIARVLESYHKRHLLSFANFRSSKNELAFRRMLKSSALLSVEEVDARTCLVSSENDENLFYTVHLDVGFCDCVYGQGGRFCKHLCAIQNKFGKIFPTSPRLTIGDRKLYAEIALGPDAPKDFYNDMEEEIEKQDEVTQYTVANEEDRIGATTESPNGEEPIQHLHGVHSSAVEELFTHFEKLRDVAKNCKTPEMTNGILKLNKVIRQISTPMQMLNYIHSVKQSQRTRKIGVQATAISRRKLRPGLTSGAKRRQAGRPSALENNQTKKRRHNLGLNITHNRPNAKSH
ncbi:uncharacterized protein LOC116158967 [Photinus pyralis]|uniref:uncharacterized protein LOC116158967 n=1 Tax=Photinus pyralis TaxID=7054 RepID=UPI0012675DEE|nr:uncharacterized protein LOC116158967 [Photinus pyralis]